MLVNNYHHNWTAKVNGKNKKIYRTNHAFQSILLKNSGKHLVIFEYKDPLLLKMHWFILIGLILILLPVLLSKKNKK